MKNILFVLKTYWKCFIEIQLETARAEKLCELGFRGQCIAGQFHSFFSIYSWSSALSKIVYSGLGWRNGITPVSQVSNQGSIPSPNQRWRASDNDESILALKPMGTVTTSQKQKVLVTPQKGPPSNKNKVYSLT